MNADAQTLHITVIMTGES